MSEVDAIAARLEHAPDVELVVHENCEHGFTHFGRDVFDECAYDSSLKGIKAVCLQAFSN